jgi:hypothetical protein
VVVIATFSLHGRAIVRIMQAVMAALVVVLASFFMPRNDDQEFVMLVSIAL